MSELAFRKMHGLGNDFVVLDARSAAPQMTPFIAAAIADRHTGVGCDQLIVIEPAENASAQAFMRIFNPDGSEAEACGNATRCVAALLMRETETDKLTLETRAGLLQAETAGGGLVRIDMGEARLDWRDIPLARELDTLHVPLADTLPDAVCTSMGNPHATIFVADADAIDLERLGPGLERHTLFPARANIAFASLLSPGRLRVRVWERGAGATLACGSGACAALVAAARRGLTGRHAEIVMEHGSLAVEWRADNHVLMTGPVATSFSGTLDLRSLGSAVAA